MFFTFQQALPHGVYISNTFQNLQRVKATIFLFKRQEHKLNSEKSQHQRSYQLSYVILVMLICFTSKFSQKYLYDWIQKWRWDVKKGRARWKIQCCQEVWARSVQLSLKSASMCSARFRFSLFFAHRRTRRATKKADIPNPRSAQSLLSYFCNMAELYSECTFGDLWCKVWFNDLSLFACVAALS